MYRAGVNRVRHRSLAVAFALVAFALMLAAGAAAGGATGSPGDPADLALTKSDSPDPVTSGGTLTYTIQVRNLGPDAATNVTVSDKLPAAVDFISADASSGSCQIQGNIVTCNLGTLANGATGTVTIRVRPTRRGNVTNTASVSSDLADPRAHNNRDSARTMVTEGPAPTAPTCRHQTATLVGTSGDDSGPHALVGTAGPDVIVALGGDDEIFAGDGRDLICAGAGNDYVVAGARADFVRAGAGNDRVLGRGGGDELRGNRGRDRLRGNRGSDLLVGGRGFDRCFGGPGRDRLRGCE